VGQAVRTLSEGLPVDGIALLAGEIFLLRWKRRWEVEVYGVISYTLRRCLHVPNANRLTDMTSCEHYLCLYFSDHMLECVHKLDYLQGAATSWEVGAKPWSVSVNAAHNVLVTCTLVGKIKEMSGKDGSTLLVVQLPGDVMNPTHAIQLTSGNFLVCHGRDDDPVRRVCMISADGRQIVHSHDGQSGPYTDQRHVPRRLAVDNNEFVFVADVKNRQVTLLSPTLQFMRHVVSSDKLNGDPRRLCIDVQRQRLYVTDNEYDGRQFTRGRVVVFSI